MVHVTVAAKKKKESGQGFVGGNQQEITMHN